MINELIRIIEKHGKIDIFYHNDLDGKMSFFLMRKFITENFTNKLIKSFAINYDEKERIYNSKNLKIILDIRFRFGEDLDYQKIYNDKLTFENNNQLLQYVKKSRFQDYILIDHHSQKRFLEITEKHFIYLEKSNISTTKIVFDMLKHTFNEDFSFDIDLVNQFDTGQYNFLSETGVFYFFSQIARIFNDYQFDNINLKKVKYNLLLNFLGKNQKCFVNKNNDFILFQKFPKNYNKEFFIALQYSILKLELKDFFLIFEYENENENKFFSLRATEKTAHYIKKIVSSHDGHPHSRGIETRNDQEYQDILKKIRSIEC